MSQHSINFTKQVPVAIAAIGQHIHEHSLPLPLSIDVHPERDLLTVRLIGVRSGAAEAWLCTLVLDGEVNELVAGFRDQYRTAWSVRLPATGVQFELVAYRAAPFLSAVSA